ncbi:CRISPR-associated protein, Cse1 family (plasmid) [Deinococcus proteolyticus MRP]|uniref:CRISPR-associated protein, Cse1 family n=1 Tax=Deinococcus proteolyticus (strain ATCC 35074 / DSM 20540 / JCM 6276 / NBRC 101906 / NCIMB 13154 / VKM Ac-1939 / CCM 2703 / MRP) TaxID=693977 RepID=F0RQW8_DEIPM|nr:type I-E CRISPR-associated protein Cse1/CasA [Deinococcus proteolyticus]ADY27677.1 CRISPR-associated protein, Cse1 family [Deinococcus proteolyticus MRP]
MPSLQFRAKEVFILVSFSLLRENWVPVLDLEGKTASVSLSDTLLTPQLYRRIDAGHPLHTAALYRLHLALLHRALGPSSAEDAAQWYSAGFPSEKVQAYLECYADRFDLFGPQPFMQVVGLDPASVGENFRSHWTRLSTEDGSPNTTALFNVEARPNGGRMDEITAAEAAVQLLSQQSFTLGGLIKRFTTSARAAPVATAALFLAEGHNLQQMLALNLVPYTASMAARDLPVWEQPPLTVADIQRIYADKEPKPRPAEGFVSRYAWPSRSILLLPEQTEGGLKVRTIGFGAGVPLAGAGEGAGANLDPMVGLLPSRDDKGDPYPYKLRRDRLLWRDLTALLPSPEVKVSEAKDGKGKKKVTAKPGRTAYVLEHAAEVMRLVQAQRQPAAPPVRPVVSQSQAAELDEPLPDAPAAPPVLPVVVFGQLTDQGKAFAIRQETYTLPQRFIENPEHFHDYIKGSLETATMVGNALWSAVKHLAEELLKKDGSRSPDPADIRKLSEQTDYPSKRGTSRARRFQFSGLG